jgi:hypothetical protein
MSADAQESIRIVASVSGYVLGKTISSVVLPGHRQPARFLPFTLICSSAGFHLASSRTFVQKQLRRCTVLVNASSV